ncbi:MAG: PDZ domain-containing protein [Planctomycetota bacterium]|nr:PDZ domain-containing protein [Planctomycetota bacterium]
MKLHRFILLPLLVLVVAGIAFAEDEPKDEVPNSVRQMNRYAKYLSVVKGMKGDIETVRRFINIRIEGDHVQRILNDLNISDSMALYVGDDIIMFHHEGNAGVFVNRGEQAEKDEDETFNVHLPNDKMAEAVALGRHEPTNIVFAKIGLPEDAQIPVFKPSVTPVSVGKKVFVIGRRASEWSFRPFYLRAEVNGELPLEGGLLAYSLDLPQKQLAESAVGALVVSEDGELLGVVHKIKGKKLSYALCTPDYFAEAILTAKETPDELAPLNLNRVRMRVPNRPVPPRPEEPQEELGEAFLGVAVEAVSEQKAQQIGLEKPEGLIITRIGEKSPAQKAGLKVGDVILEAAGIRVSTATDLKEIVMMSKPGDVLNLLLFREGKRMDHKVKLGEKN